MKWIVKLVLAGAALAAIFTGCASFDEWQRRAIFQTDASGRYGSRPAPATVEEFDLPLADGEHVRAWYLAATERHAATMLFLHGARRDLNGNGPRLERLQALGFNVLAIDYRGFGASSARVPSEASALDDARAALAELRRREPDPARRFVYGYSLGGALAIALAAEADGLAGVIVESSFTSIADVVRQSRWGWVPGLALLVTQQFNSLDRAPQINEPLLLIHGTADGLIPHTMSDQLFAAAAGVPDEHKRLLKIDGGRHWGAIWADSELFGRSVREFAAMASRLGAVRTSGVGVMTAKTAGAAVR
ncbi:MAG TPA: alpha/beta fold hydrolase [Burkholderiaceae bacterium]|nr:alpha/beta fold hydrolase [Burkholderiaceae bacterium]